MVRPLICIIKRYFLASMAEHHFSTRITANLHNIQETFSNLTGCFAWEKKKRPLLNNKYKQSLQPTFISGRETCQRFPSQWRTLKGKIWALNTPFEKLPSGSSSCLLINCNCCGWRGPLSPLFEAAVWFTGFIPSKHMSSSWSDMYPGGLGTPSSVTINLGLAGLSGCTRSLPDR